MGRKKSGVISAAAFWWILIIIAVGVMSAVILYPKLREKNKKVSELETRQAVLARKEAERNMYMEQVDALNNDPDTVERVAKDKYHLFKKDEKVIHFTK